MRGSRVNAPVGLVRTMQIIVAALTVGCFGFLVVAVAVVGGPKEPSETPLFTYLFSALAVCLVLARFIVPGIFIAQARKKIRQGTWTSPVQHIEADWAKQNSDIGKLTQVLVSRTIIAAAILEGAVFMLLTAYFVEQSSLSLILAVLLIIALAAQISTRSRVEGWLDEQMRLLDEERAF